MTEHVIHPGRVALAIAMGALATGCTVGPDFHTPASPVPPRFERAGTQANMPASQSSTEFWTAFGDPQLTALVEQALLANNDLKVALANHDRAEALLGRAQWDLLPSVTVSAQGGRERLSRDQAYGFPRNHDTYSAGINLSWELDLFGRVRRQVESQQAAANATASDFAAMQVAIAAETATTYLELRGLQERLRVLRENVDRLTQMRQVVDARLDAGRGTEFDSTRSRLLLSTASSRVPALEIQIATAQHRLAVLTGKPPAALVAALDLPQALPTPPATMPADTPADVLRRRPDIASAEARLHAATARVGVATADLFPRLTLGGLIGTQAYSSDALFKSGSESNHVLLGIDWSFLDVGRVRSRIAASHAEAAAQLASYQQTVLLALEETENALVRYDRTRREERELELAASNSARSAEFAKLQYGAGKIELFEFLDVERDLLSSQAAFAEGRTRSAIAAVNLYKALAGGWPARAPESLHQEATSMSGSSPRRQEGPDMSNGT